MNVTKKNGFIFAALTASGALAFIAAGGGSCSNDNTAVVPTTSYAYDNPYLYDSYYPADVAYSGYYWADSWDYAGFYYAAPAPSNPTGAAGTSGSAGHSGTVATGGTGGTTGAGGSGGATATGIRATIAAVIEALARGEDVCPGQVTVTPKWATPVCSSSLTQERNGVTINFNGCQVNGAGKIDGMFDVQSNRSASAQTCTPATTISLGHTSTSTNLSFTNANGGKVVIPAQTDTAMTTYLFGSTPTMTHISSTGEIQLFDASGTMISDHTYSGDNTFTFSGNRSYSVDGTTTVQEKNGGASATLTKTGLVRSGGCCRPTGGTVVVNRTGGLFPGQATWTFGSTCGSVMRDNVSATLPACL